MQFPIYLHPTVCDQERIAYYVWSDKDHYICRSKNGTIASRGTLAIDYSYVTADGQRHKAAPEGVSIITPEQAAARLTYPLYMSGPKTMPGIAAQVWTTPTSGYQIAADGVPVPHGDWSSINIIPYLEGTILRMLTTEEIVKLTTKKEETTKPMKKTIKCAIKNEGAALMMQITEQSHRGPNAFEGSADRIDTPNGIKIASVTCPAWTTAFAPTTLFIRGATSALDMQWFPVPLNRLAEIIAAIEWYNNHDFVDAPPAPETAVDAEYREAAKQLMSVMKALPGQLTAMPERYRKAAIAAYAMTVWGFDTTSAAFEALGCQADKARKMMAAIEK
jgi:hypothetical protein